MRIIKSNNEIKKTIYNVSRPDHFGSIKKMPVRPEVADEREESQAEMSDAEVKQKVAEYDRTKITPAIEAQIRTLTRETGWSWTRGFFVDIYEEKEMADEGAETTDEGGTKPIYKTSVEHMGLMQEQDMAYESPERSRRQHYANFLSAIRAMMEIYEEAGYKVTKETSYGKKQRLQMRYFKE